MVSSGRGRLMRRKDGKYLIYVPLDLAKDSMFPFSVQTSIPIKASFTPGGPKRLIIEPYTEPIVETE